MKEEEEVLSSSGINKLLLKDVLEEKLKEDIEVLSLEVYKGSNVGEGYYSRMISVYPRIKFGRNGEETRVPLMIKLMPDGEEQKKFINQAKLFLKEFKMYSEVVPDLIKFQKQKGIKDMELFKEIPKFYYSYHDSNKDYIIMENLNASGYKISNRFSGLSYNHSKLLMEKLAKFHACSYAKFNGNYDLILKMYPYLVETMVMHPDIKDNPHKALLNPSFKIICDNLRNRGYEIEAEKLEKVYKGSLNGYKCLYSKMYEMTALKVKNAVITHGDLNCNNLLFKHSADQDTPTDLKFIDFQGIRAGSRALDLSYFFYGSVQMDVLNERKLDLLKKYFKFFKQFSRELGCNMDDDAFDWDCFLKEYSDFRFYGFVMGILTAPYSTSSDGVDFDSLLTDANNNNNESPIKAQEQLDDLWKHNTASDRLNKKIVNLVNKHYPIPNTLVSSNKASIRIITNNSNDLNNNDID